MAKQFRNVREEYMLVDTVGVYDTTGKNYQNPDGWFQNFVTMGAANEINFFNVRNKQAGAMYCNMDSRDQMPYAFEASSIGVAFFSNTMTQAPAFVAGITFSPEDITGHIFMVDLPRHCSVTLRIQQDDRLKATAMMLPPGYGPCGGGYARGAPSTLGYTVADNGINQHSAIVTQGTADRSGRFPFPKPLMIPRRATLNVKISINEYGRTLLAAMTNLAQLQGVDTGAILNPTFSGIQVTIGGQRLVQQRGQYHV